jgi:hypothetical protein
MHGSSMDGYHSGGLVLPSAELLALPSSKGKKSGWRRLRIESLAGTSSQEFGDGDAESIDQSARKR